MDSGQLELSLPSELKTMPLATRMRPRILEEYIGQSHLLSPGKAFYEALKKGHIHSLILWGPPGTGKTTLARLIADFTNGEFVTLSAVLSGVKEIREAIEQAKNSRVRGKSTILFVDEVHRFNKAQQDAFLPHIEEGTIIFIGATTENPSFELNNALLSRARVYVLQSLKNKELKRIVQQALTDKERGLGEYNIKLSEHAIEKLINAADGDARQLLNYLERVIDFAAQDMQGKWHVEEQTIQEVLTLGVRRFDNGGDEFYQQISALHKAVRGSDPDAALYWFVRMIDGGCDPKYIARRVTRIASEDIGNADPRALTLCIDAWQTYERLGSPEGELAIAQAVVYLAVSPKSNAVYQAYNSAMADAKSQGTLPVPLHLRNASTQLHKSLDYGKNYRYAHNEENAFAAGESYMPEGLEGREYYHPVERGLEIKIAEKLSQLRQLNKKEQAA